MNLYVVLCALPNQSGSVSGLDISKLAASHTTEPVARVSAFTRAWLSGASRVVLLRDDGTEEGVNVLLDEMHLDVDDALRMPDGARQAARIDAAIKERMWR